MGTGEGGTPTKTTKTSTAPEQHTSPSYNEWVAAMQAYYGSGAAPAPPGYFPATVASGPQPFPFVWAGQPMMAAYGTPPPGALYSYGGIYGHPSMPPGAHPYGGQYAMPSPGTEIALAATPASTEAETKFVEGKDRNAIRRSKGSLGSLGTLTSKGSEGAKGTSGSANGHLQSDESGTEGSSDGSDEDTTENKRSFDHLATMDGIGYTGHAGDAYMNQGHALGNPVNQAVTVAQTAVSGQPAASGGLTTNLNIGMDYWGGPNPVPLASMKGKPHSAGMVQSAQLSRDGMLSELWLQDERELKRQRRKQSNRESARRSRLRKQAECEELSLKVDSLSVENMALRTELTRLAEECQKLSSEKASLLDQLQKVEGEDTLGSREQDVNREGNQSDLSEGNVPDQNRDSSGSPKAGPRNEHKVEAPCEAARKVSSFHQPPSHSDDTAAG